MELGARTKWTAVVSAIALLVGAHGAASTGLPVARLAGPDLPPYYVDDGGHFTGCLADILTRTFERAGYRWTGEVYPMARLVALLNAGRIDAAILTRVPLLDRATGVLRGDRPVAGLNLVLYSYENPFPINKISDLRGHSVLVTRGFGYGSLRDELDDPANAIQLIEADSYASIIRQLAAGRGDTALLYEKNYQATITQMADPPAGIVANPFRTLPLYIWISKSTFSDPAAALARLMNAHQKVQREGGLPTECRYDGPEP